LLLSADITPEKEDKVELEAVHSHAQIRSRPENIAVKGRMQTGKI
jgi:hypothetical protein